MGLPARAGGRRADTAPDAIGWWRPSGRRFPLPLPLPGSRSGRASRWGHWLCSAVWSSDWPCGTTGRSVRTVVSVFRWEPWLRSAVLPSGPPWGSFSGGTAGRSARTAVMVPWAGTSAGPGSPSSCGPALLPVSWLPSGGRSTWRCCWPCCSLGRCLAEVRVPGLDFRCP